MTEQGTESTENEGSVPQYVLYWGRAALVALTLVLAALPSGSLVLDAAASAYSGGSFAANVENAADAVGTPDDDILRGAGEGVDRIEAGAGDDLVWSRGGNDTVVLGQGEDYVSAGSGSDAVNSRDGEADVVWCGPDVDAVLADELDVLNDCERHAVQSTANP